MPIRIRHPDKAGASTEEPDISPVTCKVMHHLEAPYTGLEAVFGVLGQYEQCYAEVVLGHSTSKLGQYRYG